MQRTVAATVLCALLASSPAFAQESEPSPNPSLLPVPKARTVVTHHSARIGGREIQYTATAGTILLTNAKDQPTASMFYVAYVADNAGTKASRPITFAYNGGPGGSSALIHIGAFGPRTVVTTNAAATHPAPYQVVDNEDSLLDTSDLVFIDAIGTGYSKIVGHGTPKDFYGVDEDGRAFEQFIRRYIGLNGRWNSPKYLAGESYGTTRSVVLGRMLQRDGIELNGITLISTVLDFSTLDSDYGNDLPYWLFLPTEAAIADFHHKLPQPAGDLPDFLQRARTFAQGPYMQALAKGSALPAAERDSIAQQLHALTGLPLDYILRSGLRIEPERFQKELLSGDDRTTGRYDGRFTSFDLDPIAADAETDPTENAVFGAFTAAFNQYIREELDYQSDDNYVFLGRVGRDWNWNRGSDGTSGDALNVSQDLQKEMTVNPYLRIFSANGIYDMATPFFATEYSLAHLRLAAPLQAHITYGYYPAGHMIYLNPVAHAALKRDLTAFYR